MIGTTIVGTRVQGRVEMRNIRQMHPYNLLIALVGWVVVVYQISGFVAAAVSFLSASALQAGINQAADVRSRLRGMVRVLQFSLPLMLLYTLIQAALSSDQSSPSSAAGTLVSSAPGAEGLSRILWVGPTVPTLGQLMITTGSLLGGIDRALHLWALLLGVMAITRMIRPDHVTVWLGRHFGRVGLTISMMMNFLPLMQAEYHRIHEYVWLRAGIGSDAKWRDRLRATGAVLQALLMNALERSWFLAESMFVRGYGARVRTFYHHTPWRTRDTWTLTAWVLLGAAAVVLNVANPGTGGMTANPSAMSLGAQCWLAADVLAASLICLWMGGLFHANRDR